MSRKIFGKVLHSLPGGAILSISDSHITDHGTKFFGGRTIMSLRKLLISAAAAVCAVSLLVPAAFAHGGCHGRAARRTAQPCAVAECTAAGWHYHSQSLYCGHTHGGSLCDGSCAPLCQVEGCELAGRHTHDGVAYCGNCHDAGYCDGACLALCDVEGCTLTGRHDHNGITYCGSNHASGWCDGSCPAYRAASPRGHHGCHN